jgi:photosystem I subunit 11
MTYGRDTEVVQPYNDDPLSGNLATPINSSALVKTFINNLPAYRKGISPILRGLEIGLAHGYFLVGPEVVLGPLRDSPEASNLGGLITAIALVLIATVCLSVYGIVSFQGEDPFERDNPQLTSQLKTAESWSQFTGGFFIGATGGAFVAFFLLENFGVVDSIFRGLVNN